MPGSKFDEFMNRVNIKCNKSFFQKTSTFDGGGGGGGVYFTLSQKGDTLTVFRLGCA